MPLLPKPFYLHELASGVPARGLKRVRTSAHDDRRLDRRTPVDDGARPARRPDGLAAPPRQYPRESEVHALQRPRRSGAKLGRRIPEGVDQLVGALVPLAPLADAAIHDLLQMIAARQPADLGGPDAGARVALHEHPEKLTDLIHVVARLPFRRGAFEDVARRGQRIECPRPDAAPCP